MILSSQYLFSIIPKTKPKILIQKFVDQNRRIVKDYDTVLRVLMSSVINHYSMYNNMDYMLSLIKKIDGTRKRNLQFINRTYRYKGIPNQQKVKSIIWWYITCDLWILFLWIICELMIELTREKERKIYLKKKYLFYFYIRMWNLNLYGFSVF